MTAKKAMVASSRASASTPVLIAPPSKTGESATLTAALISALRDPSADTAREAAILLGKSGDAVAVKPLADVVTNLGGYYHSVVRAAACASLGQLGDPSATPALLVGINDPMAEASAEAVRALATLGDRRAIDPLVAVLRNERGYFLPVVRRAAVTAPRQFNDPRAVAALQAIAANPSEDAVVRTAAV